MKHIFSVNEDHRNERLDRFLVQQLPQYSRSQLQKLIMENRVLVNEKNISKHYSVQAGDVVTVLEAEARPDTRVIPPIAVLFEDEHLIVVNKPVGVLVHQAPGTKEYTVADFLQTRCPEITHVGENPLRPGIVHRLDRAVSGVLIAAKTEAAYRSLKKQFQDRSTTKEYRAIVHDVPGQSVGVIQLKIARSSTVPGKMAARPEAAEGREAITRYEVLKTIHRRYAFLAVEILTGRTHQIRAHLAAIGHPVVGDTLYQSKKYPRNDVERLFLHAFRLTVEHPASGERQTFEAPLPQEFTSFLAA